MYSERTLLGQGKCGPVYRSQHPLSGEPVLLKICATDGSAAAPLDAALVEQHAPQWSQIGGAQIARLLAVERLPEGLGIVSEYVSAPTLAQSPLKGSATGAQVLDLTNQLLQALMAGEKLRQIHGDVKPSNVLISINPEGRPHLRLTDWGLNQTRSQPPVESLLFHAPEHLDGSAPTLRGDLFSIGAVLYYLCTGQPLVKGRQPAEIAAAWSQAAPPPLGQLRPDLPTKLVNFILSLLALRPDQRPANHATAQRLLAELNPPPPPQATGPAAPAAATVPLQGNMRPPGAPTSGVAIAAMRPPPAIAEQIRASAPAVGSQTQPFVTGVQGAIPQGVRTQPIHATDTVPTAHRTAARQPAAAPAAAQQSVIKPLLTLLVLISLGCCGYYFWTHKAELTKAANPTTEAPAETATEMMDRIKKAGKK